MRDKGYTALMYPPRFTLPANAACQQGRGFAASVERDCAAVSRAVQQSSRNLAWLVRAR
ncbi:hypothetical protein MASSI9I_90559 [Massilia sp. 9I]|nr:hypothetical protein MASSI9I_90559 [Massilia sp. 9I]